MIEINRLKSALQASWDAKTSSYGDNRKPLSAGQCAVTALIIQDYLAGNIVKTKTNGITHYYNIINNKKLDLTRDQFNEIKSETPPETVNRKEFDRETLERYLILKSRVCKYLLLTRHIKQ